MVFDSSNSSTLLRENREVTKSVTQDIIINKITPLHYQQMKPTKEEEEVMGVLKTWEHLTPGNKLKVVIIISSSNVCAQKELAIHNTKLTKNSSDLNSNKKPKSNGKLIVLISPKIVYLECGLQFVN